MKTKYLAAALGLVVLGLSSCSDFLTEDPKGQLTPESFFASQADLDASVNALYYQVQQSQCNSNPLIVQCQGDDMTSTTGSNKAAYLSADSFNPNPADYKGQQWLWRWNYNIIQAANLIIDNAAKTPVGQDAINEAMGQAYFWRAYSYFSLVRVFGPLPINLHNEADNNTTTLTSVEEVYNLIVSDLTEAEKCNLPAEYPTGYKRLGSMNVFISQQAVKSLLAAVYMNMAGYPLNKTEYYANAADKAKEVVDGINSGKYPNAMCTDWKDVYSYGNNYSSECIVGMVFQSNYGSWSNSDSQLSSCHQFGSLFGGWGDFLAERYFWSKFPAGPRKDCVYASTIMSGYKDPTTDQYVNVDWWATLDGEKYDETKANGVIKEYRPLFLPFSVNADDTGKPVAAPYDVTKPFYTNMCLDKTHQLLRSSEVYCWFAEAAARAGKYTAEAKAALEKVMARAYTTLPSYSDLAQQAWLEHGYEVAGNAYSIVTRRADEFRLDKLKEAYDYRAGAQSAVLVPAGTETQSVDADGVPFTYTTKEDVVLKENMDVLSETPSWQGINSIYQDYPPLEKEKNPNLHR